MAITITILGLVMLALCLIGAAVVCVTASAGDERMDAAIQAKRELDAERNEFLQKEAKEAKEDKASLSSLPSVKKEWWGAEL